MKIIVTGGAGFIGSHIQDALLNQNHEVLILDNLRSGKEENIHKLSRFENIDIRDRKSVLKIFEEFKPDAVFHLAAQNEVPYSMDHPEEDHDINIEGTINILEGCKLNKTKIIFSNTGGALYGEVEDIDLPIKEDLPIINPTSYYGTSKLCAEQYIKLYGNLYQIPWVSLRYANVYGPRQAGNREAGIVAIFTSKMLAGETPTINGKGEHTRDYVFVEDVVSANLKALEYNKNDYFNISTGTEISNQTVYDTLAKILGIKIPANYGPNRPGDPVRNSLDNSKARSTLNWEVKYDFQSGVQKTVDYYKAQIQ